MQSEIIPPWNYVIGNISSRLTVYGLIGMIHLDLCVFHGFYTEEEHRV